MKPVNLILRGYARREESGLWYAVCLDFCLASQGNSLEETMENLHLQIKEYVYDAVSGQDKEHIEYLLNRSAPLSQWATYYGLLALDKLHVMKNGFVKLFSVPLPLPLPLAAPLSHS
ncbi:MAG: hypothetical protein U1F12_10390 [Pseudomonadales bacterium]|jgi:predicted RNase H-like HicB family nuclease